MEDYINIELEYETHNRDLWPVKAQKYGYKSDFYLLFRQNLMRIYIFLTKQNYAYCIKIQALKK